MPRIFFQAGSRLVEIMAFAVIVGLLAAIVSPNIVSAWGSARARTANHNQDKIVAILLPFALENDEKAMGLVNYPGNPAPDIIWIQADSMSGFPAVDIHSTSVASTSAGSSLNDLVNPP